MFYSFIISWRKAMRNDWYGVKVFREFRFGCLVVRSITRLEWTLHIVSHPLQFWSVPFDTLPTSFFFTQIMTDINHKIQKYRNKILSANIGKFFFGLNCQTCNLLQLLWKIFKSFSIFTSFFFDFNTNRILRLVHTFFCCILSLFVKHRCRTDVCSFFVAQDCWKL